MAVGAWQVGHYRQILAEPAYRRFWLGATGSVLGDAMTRAALTWHVWATTGSTEALGWLMLCYTGPLVISGLLAGALLDRFDRRRVMLIDSLLRGATMALIPLLALVGRLELWHLYAAAVIYGTLMMISLAGGPSLIPSLVRREYLSTANALEMLSFTLGSMIGPPLAGLLIAAAGAPTVLLVDALTYAGFALALATLPRGTETAGPATRSGSSHLGQAVGLLIGNPILLATTLMYLALNIGGGMLPVWLPLLTDRQLGGGPGLYGLLLGALATGQLAGVLLAGSLVLPLALGRLIGLAQMLAGMALLLVLLGHSSALAVGLGLALFGLFSGPLTVWAQTLRMRIIPPEMRGRAFALLRMLMQSGNPIGGVAAGTLIPAIGLLWLIGLAALIAGLPGLLGQGVPALRHAGAPMPAAAPPPRPTGSTLEEEVRA